MLSENETWRAQILNIIRATELLQHSILLTLKNYIWHKEPTRKMGRVRSCTGTYLEQDIWKEWNIH